MVHTGTLYQIKCFGMVVFCRGWINVAKGYITNKIKPIWWLNSRYIHACHRPDLKTGSCKWQTSTLIIAPARQSTPPKSTHQSWNSRSMHHISTETLKQHNTYKYVRYFKKKFFIVMNCTTVKPRFKTTPKLRPPF